MLDRGAAYVERLIDTGSQAIDYLYSCVNIVRRQRLNAYW